MSRVGYHCSHEQHAPSELLANVRAAERAGFGAAMCSDHFMPWTPRADKQGQSGFTWSWLGAAMQATQLTFGAVTAPGYRYHPAVVAQGIATLAEMFPDRFWIAFGSGEALNEHITDEHWPSKPERLARLRECVDVIRALLDGETVTHRGRIKVREAKLYTRPAKRPPLIGAALSLETARWCGAWADGLITVAAEPDTLRAMIETFQDAAGAKKPVYVQAVLAHAPTDAEAEQVARAWSFAAVGDGNFKADLALPEYFELASRDVTSERLRKSVRTSTSVEEHLAWIAGDLACGAERVYVHHVGPTRKYQEAFLDAFATGLLKL